jgi:hypothetical protein
MLSYFSRKRNSPQKSRTSTIKNMFSRALGSVRPSRARIHDVATELSTPRSDTPTETRHRTATQRTATQRTATQRTATPTDTRHTTATQRTATQKTATQRTARPSVRTHVQQEVFDVFNTMPDAMRSEAIALNALNLKKSNTQNEINKINRQIFLLEQMLKQRRTLEEKDRYRRQIKILKALKLELEQNLAEITIELQSAMETIQKKYSKKGGTRKRRKYAKNIKH